MNMRDVQRNDVVVNVNLYNDRTLKLWHNIASLHQK